MKPTFELCVEASRNACYSKHLRKCLFVVSQLWHLVWNDWKVTDFCSGTTSPSFPDQAGFLPAGPGCTVMARHHVLVLAGMFGPAVLIGQSVPSLSPSCSSPHKQNQEEEECTDTGSYCNRSQFGLEPYNSMKTVDVARIFNYKTLKICAFSFKIIKAKHMLIVVTDSASYIPPFTQYNLQGSFMHHFLILHWER